MIVAVYVKHTAYSIIFIREHSNSKYREHIRTRHSTTQRVWKITEDNVNVITLEWHKKIKEILNQEEQ